MHEGRESHLRSCGARKSVATLRPAIVSGYCVTNPCRRGAGSSSASNELHANPPQLSQILSIGDVGNVAADGAPADQPPLDER